MEAPSTEAIRGYVAIAEEVAPMVLGSDLRGYVSCDLGERSCVRTFIQRFGRAAFRRPLDEDFDVAAYFARTSSTAKMVPARTG